MPARPEALRSFVTPRAEKYAVEAWRAMGGLKIYKAQFSPIIRIYGELRDQYDTLTELFVASGYAFEESTATGKKKAPIITTLESLRKDILAYASQLGLTPQGLLKADASAFAQKKKNALASILEKAEK